MPQQDNERFMRRALELARRGIALASPNPHVGAVIVSSAGEIVGEGFHTYDGLKHAEVLAAEQAGERARGATLYLNLEPCSHTGRTGPCADAVIAADIKRVYAAMPDPNPLVAGKGFERLRTAGIEVHTGLLESEARKINEGFAKYITAKTPLVTLKAGMTLDGKIAPPYTPPSGEVGLGDAAGGWITSIEARAQVQELRHASDAILVGVNTVITDNPLLTDRTSLPRRRPLLRVVSDSKLRLPLDSRLVKTVNNDLIVFCSFAEEKKRRELEERGIRVEQVRLGALDGRPDIAAIIQRLGELEITSLIIEGGALVNWTALAANVVDKVFLFYAPKILAGTGSVPFASGPGFPRISEAARVRSISLHRFGEDFAVEGYIKDPYERLGSSTQ
ncbi:MAG TPA: bifunctional diaminohydroxyphosphoribosylaminopyrimidine deaminase/5-amino-6-(5-phosphoribosylamino)uracil reductase RibD [Terriglobales bacterium]|jgi:diaminohydroxyphosphoribosylaminopyrimidine deaminase/5-amino-6-(5-phosphoribosylamino)uracil reductase|nr:bifunctional diaminohydroxyphosphoribosylaminopyrimidine deaminase/5-amino-6-(5-phosphoribosylamino)uracil reductase RibD [Terriglobales bacterium]